jgi:hypothetical protein
VLELGGSLLMAASATFALKAGVWFRRGRLLIVSPDSPGTACPLSGRNSTHRPVQIPEPALIAPTVRACTLARDRSAREAKLRDRKNQIRFFASIGGTRLQPILKKATRVLSVSRHRNKGGLRFNRRFREDRSGA